MSIKSFFKELVFIDWYRKFRGTTINPKEKSEPEKSDTPTSSEENPQVNKGFNDQ